jgi:hypothetical protein
LRPCTPVATIPGRLFRRRGSGVGAASGMVAEHSQTALTNQHRTWRPKTLSNNTCKYLLTSASRFPIYPARRFPSSSPATPVSHSP